jgi:hypothetical protein
MLNIERDGNGSAYIGWEQLGGGATPKGPK